MSPYGAIRSPHIAIVFAVVPVSLAVPKINGKFCATAAFTDFDPFGPSRNYLELCIDSADLKTGKVWQVIRGTTSIVDDSYTTSLLPDGSCKAFPSGKSGSFLSTEALAILPDATLNETMDGNQTWVHMKYRNWDGNNHTCTKYNIGSRDTTVWTVSKKVTDGTQDLLSKYVRVENCLDGVYKFQQQLGYEFTKKYTRTVNAHIFDRPPSYCYDPQHWVQSHECTTTKSSPFGRITVHGCELEGDYDRCCAVNEKAKPNCGNIKNCSSIIYGKAYPSSIQV